MTLALKLFLLPGNLAADRLGARKTDDRAMIRTLVDMLFWNPAARAGTRADKADFT